MNHRNRGLTTLAAATAIVSLVLVAGGQSEAQMAVPNAEANRFTPAGSRLDPETATPQAGAAASTRSATQSSPEPISGSFFREAPAAFDNRTNGFDIQGPAFDTLNEDNVVPLRSFNDNRFIFEEVEHVEDGLGPTFNAQACRECHQNVVTGGASQVAEHRTGRIELLQFVESVGGSLIQSRSTHADIFELVPFEDSVSTFRISTNTLGNGYSLIVPYVVMLVVLLVRPYGLFGTPEIRRV